MEDSKDEIKFIEVVKFNNKEEDWVEFALKFKVIADE